MAPQSVKQQHKTGTLAAEAQASHRSNLPTTPHRAHRPQPPHCQSVQCTQHSNPHCCWPALMAPSLSTAVQIRAVPPMFYFGILESCRYHLQPSCPHCHDTTSAATLLLLVFHFIVRTRRPAVAGAGRQPSSHRQHHHRHHRGWLHPRPPALMKAAACRWTTARCHPSRMPRS